MVVIGNLSSGEELDVVVEFVFVFEDNYMMYF